MSDLVSVMAAMVLSLLSITGFVQWTKTGLANVKLAVTAGQMAILNKAVQQYVQDNSATLAAIATSTTPVTVTVANLQALNYVAPGFAATNSFGQTWQAQVLQPTAGQLETVVMSTGGTAISDPKQLVQIAAQAGAQGGYVPYAGMLGNAAYVATMAVGSLGAWTLPMGSFTNPGSGHLVSLLAFGSVAGNNSYLYRTAVAGHPELNAMQTDLSMTDTGGTAHNISGAANIAAQTVNASGAVTAGTFSGAAGRFTVDSSGRIGNAGYAPTDLPGGWGGGISTADIYSHSTVAAGSGGGISAYMNSAGQLLAGSGSFQVTNGGYTYIGYIGAASGNGCTGSGSYSMLSADAAGVLMTCLNGTWRPIGGRQQKQAFFTASDGTFIPDPGCPGSSSPRIIITPLTMYIDNTASLSYTASGSGPWTVFIRDGSNSPVGATAAVETYCAFS